MSEEKAKYGLRDAYIHVPGCGGTQIRVARDGYPEDLTHVARGLSEAKEALAGMESVALAGVAKLLSESAESLARTCSEISRNRPAEWMDGAAAAAYLGMTKGAFEKAVYREGVPRHYLTSKPLYSRVELDEWLLGR